MKIYFSPISISILFNRKYKNTILATFHPFFFSPGNRWWELQAICLLRSRRNHSANERNWRLLHRSLVSLRFEFQFWHSNLKICHDKITLFLWLRLSKIIYFSAWTRWLFSVIGLSFTQLQTKKPRTVLQKESNSLYELKIDWFEVRVPRNFKILNS